MEQQTSIEKTDKKESPYIRLESAFPSLNSRVMAIAHSTVAKGTTLEEFAYFIGVCHKMRLDPLLKLVWCYKDNKGNLLIFCGRDGFLAAAQKSPEYAGIQSGCIYENDTYSISLSGGEIEHTISLPKKERGAIVGAWARVFRRDGEPTTVFSDFNTFNKGYNAWRTHPEEMICKCAEAAALKKAFGFVPQDENQWQFSRGVAIPVRPDQHLIQSDTES